MTTDAIKAQVIELVAVAAELEPERVLLTSCLLRDLKIDGDDAVKLFNSVHERFGTDLTHLYERWRGHFGPEGIPLSAGLIIIPAAFAGGLVGASVGKVAGDVAANIAGFSAAVALIAASIWIGRKFRLVKDLAPITVDQVVQAVEGGSWPRPVV